MYQTKVNVEIMFVINLRILNKTLRINVKYQFHWLCLKTTHFSSIFAVLNFNSRTNNASSIVLKFSSHNLFLIKFVVFPFAALLALWRREAKYPQVN